MEETAGGCSGGIRAAAAAEAARRSCNTRLLRVQSLLVEVVDASTCTVSQRSNAVAV